MLARQPPSREAYVATYLECFDVSQVVNLDYVYHGAIGGAFTVGRAQFKAPVKVRDSMVREKIKAGLITEGTYDPTEMTNEPTAAAFKLEWEVHAGGKMPSWFDFPFNRRMRVFKEESEGVQSETDPRPRYEKVWYIDDEKSVVYIRGNWG